jgi:hypothetical protein
MVEKVVAGEKDPVYNVSAVPRRMSAKPTCSSSG